MVAQRIGGLYCASGSTIAPRVAAPLKYPSSLYRPYRAKETSFGRVPGPSGRAITSRAFSPVGQVQNSLKKHVTAPALVSGSRLR